MSVEYSQGELFFVEQFKTMFGHKSKMEPTMYLDQHGRACAIGYPDVPSVALIEHIDGKPIAVEMLPQSIVGEGIQSIIWVVQQMNSSRSFGPQARLHTMVETVQAVSRKMEERGEA